MDFFYNFRAWSFYSLLSYICPNAKEFTVIYIEKHYKAKYQIHARSKSVILILSMPEGINFKMASFCRRYDVMTLHQHRYDINLMSVLIKLSAVKILY